VGRSRSGAFHPVAFRHHAPAAEGETGRALVAYFLGAVIGHLRVGDTKGTAMPVMPLVLSNATLVVRLASM
jgi:hypothetical protein